MTRGGSKRTNSTSERRCIVTGRVNDPSVMVRFVLSPEGKIVPDVSGKLPGRGIWISANRADITKAVDRNMFSRAAKQPAAADDTLLTLVEDGLIRRITGHLSLARKGGYAISGFEKVKEALTYETAAVLLQAHDGSAPQKAKLRPPKPENAYISCLSAKELGQVFGRDTVIHAALSAGGLTSTIVEDANRLAGIRSMSS